MPRFALGDPAELELPYFVPHARGRDDARPFCVLEEIEERKSKAEVAHVIERERHFEPVVAQLVIVEERPRVVHEHVELRVVGAEFGGDALDIGDARHVRHDQTDIVVSRRLPQFGNEAFSLFLVSCDEDELRPSLRELTRGCFANPLRCPRDKKGFPCRSPLIGSSPVRCPMFISVFAHNCRRYIVDSVSWQIVADTLDEPNDLPLLHLVDPVVSNIVAKGGKAIAVQGNVAMAAEVQPLFAVTKKEFGKLDIPVHNAGVYSFAPIENRLRPSDWLKK